QTDERQLACGVDPEDRRARADAAERARRGGETEPVRERALAAQEEAEAEGGGEGAPTVHLARVVEEGGAHRPGLVRGGEVDDRGREDAYAVELAAATQHLRPAQHVGGRRDRAAAGDFGGLLEELVEALEHGSVEEPFGAIAYHHRHASRREIG